MDQKEWSQIDVNKMKTSSGKKSNMVLHWDRSKVSFVFAVYRITWLNYLGEFWLDPQVSMSIPINLMIRGVPHEPDGN